MLLGMDVNSSKVGSNCHSGNRVGKLEEDFQSLKTQGENFHSGVI
jgi:hypothetical protein